jgi:thioredoxin 1
MEPTSPAPRHGESAPGRNSRDRERLVIVMENIKHLDGPTFEADVIKSVQPVVVDFYADWCGPCRMMAPVLERLAVEYAGKVTIGKLDVDVNQDIAILHGVMAMPTLGLFSGGRLVDRLVGYPGSAAPIRAWIDRNLPTEAPIDIPAEAKPKVEATANPSA